MDDKITYWASVVFSALALALLVANVALLNSNRSLQNDVNQRQATISNAVGLSQVNQALVQALADAALENSDKWIKALLTEQGITYKPKTDAAKKKGDE